MQLQNPRQCSHPRWCSGPRVENTWRDLFATCTGRSNLFSTTGSGAGELSETEAILFSLAKAVEQRDAQTAGHCERLAFIALALGVAIGLERSALVALCRGGYLHDIGKVGIPDSILFKPGKLTAEEWVVMRSHPVRGEEICRPLKSLAPVLPIIRHHHERWDGSGYPDGLRQDQIPVLARIIQVADIYDALTSPRPYKAAYEPRRALEILAEETHRGWRDPRVFEVFARLHREVILEMPDSAPVGCNLESMSRSLLNLRAALSSNSRELATSAWQA